MEYKNNRWHFKGVSGCTIVGALRVYRAWLDAQNYHNVRSSRDRFARVLASRGLKPSEYIDDKSGLSFIGWAK